ncbi:hypothetical protein [Yeosuana marina]|uniref:hypothetical protein n=1 Tax=Yeosuana marina TaxID=1565536 RepID=UPI0030C7AC26
MSEPYFIEKSIQKLISKNRKVFKGTESEEYIDAKLPKIIEELLQRIWDGLYNYSFDEDNIHTDKFILDILPNILDETQKATTRLGHHFCILYI